MPAAIRMVPQQGRWPGAYSYHLSSLTALGSFSNQDLGRSDDSDSRQLAPSAQTFPTNRPDRVIRQRDTVVPVMTTFVVTAGPLSAHARYRTPSTPVQVTFLACLEEQSRRQTHVATPL